MYMYLNKKYKYLSRNRLKIDCTTICFTNHAGTSFLRRSDISDDSCAEADVALADAADDTRQHEDGEGF